jgi:hypothetical protein
MKVLAACLLTLACAAAQAQVYRCVESGTGKVVYTDESCPVGSGSGSRLVEARKSPEELEQDRQRAREAQQRLYLWQEHEARMQNLQAEGRRLAPGAATGSSAWAGSAACADAQREARAITGRAVGLTLANPEVEQAQYRVDLACLGPEQAALNAQARAATFATQPLIVVGRAYYPYRLRPMPLPPPQRWRGATRLSSGGLR